MDTPAASSMYPHNPLAARKKSRMSPDEARIAVLRTAEEIVTQNGYPVSIPVFIAEWLSAAAMISRSALYRAFADAQEVQDAILKHLAVHNLHQLKTLRIEADSLLRRTVTCDTRPDLIRYERLNGFAHLCASTVNHRALRRLDEALHRDAFTDEDTYKWARANFDELQDTYLTFVEKTLGLIHSDAGEKINNLRVYVMSFTAIVHGTALYDGVNLAPGAIIGLANQYAEPNR